MVPRGQSTSADLKRRESVFVEGMRRVEGGRMVLAIWTVHDHGVVIEE